MTNKLLNAQLGTAFTIDPAVGLWTYLKSIWGTTTGYTVPNVTKIKFDTKFGEQKGFFNFIIIENMPQMIKPQILGAGRFRTNDVKRLQIMCLGPSCKDTKWKMERHIESLLNGNVTGMQATYGIDEFTLSEFAEIPVQPDPNITALMPTKIDQVRSRALVTLIYDEYQATA
jgi:hypothetical protein